MSATDWQEMRFVIKVSINQAKGRLKDLFVISPSRILDHGRLLVVLMILIQLAGSIFDNSQWDIHGLLHSLLVLAAWLAAALSMTAAAKWSIRQSRPARLAWILLAAAALTLALARLVRLVGPAQPPAIPVSFLFEIIFSVLFLASALLLMVNRRQNRSLIRYSLDVLLVGLSSILITWLYFISPALASIAVGPAAWLIRLSKPVSDLVALWAAFVLLSQAIPARFRLPPQLLGAGGLAVVLVNGLTVGLLAGTSFSNTFFPELLDLLAPCLMILAGAIQSCQVSSSGKLLADDQGSYESGLRQTLRRSTPAIWVGVVYLLFLTVPIFKSLGGQLQTAAWVTAIVVLMIVRQVIELGETGRLKRALHELNGSVDQQVAERTAVLSKANADLRQKMIERAHIEQILREREEAMEHAAMHDPLTELPNRLLLMEHLRQAIRKLHRWEAYQFAVLLLDFDGYKQVNDRLGHLIGDQVLIAAAKRIRSYVREVDTVARLGGDEFVILLEDIAEGDSLLTAVERIGSLLSEPYEVEGQRVRMSASIGVVTGNKTYQQPADLLRDADLAMYEAKAHGKNRYVVFTAELSRHVLDRLVLEDDLRAAQVMDELFLVYQPIMCLETGRIVAFEALLRWQHPQRGLINPNDFITIAETAHLIAPLTRRVLKMACTRMQAWQAGHPLDSQLKVSVNLSSRLFAQPADLSMVEEILAESGLSPRSLSLEITEDAMDEDSQSAHKMLSAWRALGVQIQIDDFGTGRSSLSHLHRFPIDGLKIDRSFIEFLGANGEQGEIPRTIITLARELNLKVVAEGVENDGQLAFLKSLGCQYAQGFLISRPLPPDDVQPFLRAYSPNGPMPVVKPLSGSLAK